MRQDYAYITGKIRQLETGLPDEIDLERMIDAPDASAAFAVLNDTDYASHLLELAPEDYYSALHNDWRGVRELLDKSVPDQLLLDILYLREDFNNLKLVLKTHLQGLKLAGVRVTDAGSVSKEDWLSYFAPETRSRLNKFWQQIIVEILRRVGGQPESQLVDREADKVYLQTYKELAVKFKNKFIIMLAEIEIDVMNVKALMRARRLKRGADWLAQQLADGGYIKVSEICTWLELDSQELLLRFKHRLPYTIFQEIEKGQNNGVTEVIEHAMYTWRRRYLKRANYIAYGPEHVVKYFYAKIRAMVNVRVAMTGKLNNLRPEEIKQRIRL